MLLLAISLWKPRTLQTISQACQAQNAKIARRYQISLQRQQCCHWSNYHFGKPKYRRQVLRTRARYHLLRKSFVRRSCVVKSLPWQQDKLRQKVWYPELFTGSFRTYMVASLRGITQTQEVTFVFRFFVQNLLICELHFTNKVIPYNRPARLCWLVYQWIAS